MGLVRSLLRELQAGLGDNKTGQRIFDTISGLMDGTQAISTGAGAAAGTGVTAEELPSGVRKVTITFTAAAVTMADNAGVVAYGSLKIYDLPAGAILFHGATTDLALTLSAAGIDADWNGDVGLGTVAADNGATLATTEQNLIPTTATPVASASATTAKSQSTATESGTIFDGTATATDVYLNLLVDDADHDVTGTATNIIVNGTITFYYANLGDY